LNGHSSTDIDPLRLLVVEDDDDTRANLVDILELDRHLVSTAKSVATTLQDRDWSAIDGIILDRKLPDGSAETLLPKLREIAPQADVIIVTGFADLDGTITALRQGVADYIIKPINPEVLRATFARLAKQRRIQHELVRAQEKAIQSERLATIGQTMAGLAHESRNALQRIKAGIELIELDCQDRPQVLRDLARISEASEDLRSLLDEVRSYAAPIHLEFQPTLIASIWRRAWESLKIRLGDQNVTVDDTQANVELKADVDAGRLERVFRNLFENSLDACPEPVEIIIDCHANEKSVNIVVSDNGPGLPPEDKDKLFDAFFTTKADGTGLGLSITRRIIEAHDGTIIAASSDRGARFVITLPATRGG
jgi:signal transduction histidine kinase